MIATLTATLTPSRRWARRNRRALLGISALLILAAAFGALGPPRAGLSSTAGPYNLFHLVAGLIGLAVFTSRRGLAAAQFNFGFGLIDLYQAPAGVLGLFPARLFGLRPADHVVHLLFGLALVAIGARGLRRR